MAGINPLLTFDKKSGEPRELDCRGLRCPLPVLRVEKALDHARTGTRLVVLATDPVARIDIPLYCRRHGHAVSIEEEANGLRFTITVGGAA